MSNTTNDDLAVAARYSSAEARTTLTRIRRSMEILEARAVAVTDPQRRHLLARASATIMDAFQTREAARRLPMTATSTPFLRAIDLECTSIMSTCAAYIDRLSDHAYAGLDPIMVAVRVAGDLNISEPPAKSKAPSTAQRARDQFDQERKAIRQKRWTVTDLSAIKRAGDGTKPMVRLIASSDSIDLEGDAFTVSALKDMRRDMIGHAAFIQHKYDPLDIFGMITDATVTADGGKHLLRMDVDVATENEKARNVYALIKSGVKLGASVGVIVLSGAPDKQNPRQYNIDHVKGLETSIVGLPANWTDAWVESAKSVDGVKQINAELAMLRSAYS